MSIHLHELSYLSAWEPAHVTEWLNSQSQKKKKNNKTNRKTRSEKVVNLEKFDDFRGLIFFFIN